MNETIMSVAIIGALAAAITAVIKAFWSKNQNVSSQHDYELKLVELVSKQGQSVEGINASIVRIHERVDKIDERLSTIETELKNSGEIVEK